MQEDIVKWKPDVVILVDYPGFNLKIAKFLKRTPISLPIITFLLRYGHGRWRIRSIKRDIAELSQSFAILRCRSSKEAPLSYSLCR